MSTPTRSGLPALWSVARVAVRHLTAIVLATIAGGVVWIVSMTLFNEAGLIDLNFPRLLATEVGVDGRRQTVGVAGLGLTMAGALLVVLAHALVVEPRFARRSNEPEEATGGGPVLLATSLPAFVLTLVLTGLVATPVMGLGILGLADDGALAAALVASAALSSIAAVRVYSLVITPRWWEPKDGGVQHAFAEGPARPSFELPEERREEGGEGARR